MIKEKLPPLRNPGIDSLVKDYSFRPLPDDLKGFADVLVICTITGLEKEQFFPDKSITDEQYRVVCEYINLSSYMIFKPELTHSEISEIRQRMSDLAEIGNKMPTDLFENSKLRSNQISASIANARVLFDKMEDMVDKIPKTSPYYIDSSEFAIIFKEMFTLWKKETTTKLSNNEDLPWDKIYDARNQIRQNGEIIRQGGIPLPVIIDGREVDKDLYQSIFDYVEEDEYGDYFNVDKKIIFVRDILIPFLRKILVTYEAFIELTVVKKNVDIEAEIIQETIELKMIEQSGVKRQSVV